MWRIIKHRIPSETVIILDGTVEYHKSLPEEIYFTIEDKENNNFLFQKEAGVMQFSELSEALEAYNLYIRRQK